MKTPLAWGAALLLAPLAALAQTPTPTPGAKPGTFDPGKSFTGVRTQQGRVQTDADWNEQLQACKRQNEALKRELKMRASELERQLNQMQAAADKADADKKNTQGHTKAIKDSIQKMLDQVAAIHRATNL